MITYEVVGLLAEPTKTTDGKLTTSNETIHVGLQYDTIEDAKVVAKNALETNCSAVMIVRITDDTLLDVVSLWNR